MEDMHIGHLVNASLKLTSSESLWLPTEAVLNLGVDQVVFVKRDGLFKPFKVGTGIRTNGQVEITKGLASADEVAANAQLLVDSESFVKVQPL
jgi:hypothetical protein